MSPELKEGPKQGFRCLSLALGMVTIAAGSVAGLIVAIRAIT